MSSKLVTETVIQVTDSDIDTDSDAYLTDQPQHACPVEEGELSDHDQDTTAADLDHALSKEKTYTERQ